MSEATIPSSFKRLWTMAVEQLERDIRDGIEDSQFFEGWFNGATTRFHNPENMRNEKYAKGYEAGQQAYSAAVMRDAEQHDGVLGSVRSLGVRRGSLQATITSLEHDDKLMPNREETLNALRALQLLLDAAEAAH
jgi:hypothetical protein